MNFMSWGVSAKAQRVTSALNFPNQSRSLDLAHGCVSFWGYSSTIEVTLLIGVDLLRAMEPTHLKGDDGMLEAFDHNRAVIEKAAGTAYSREHATFCRLNPSDF